MKISALPANQQVDLTDKVLVNDSGGTKTATIQQIKNIVMGSTSVPAIEYVTASGYTLGDLSHDRADHFKVCDYTGAVLGNGMCIGLAYAKSERSTGNALTVSAATNGRYTKMQRGLVMLVDGNLDDNDKNAGYSFQDYTNITGEITPGNHTSFLPINAGKFSGSTSSYMNCFLVIGIGLS